MLRICNIMYIFSYILCTWKTMYKICITQIEVHLFISLQLIALWNIQLLLIIMLHGHVSTLPLFIGLRMSLWVYPNTLSVIINHMLTLCDHLVVTCELLVNPGILSSWPLNGHQQSFYGKWQMAARIFYTLTYSEQYVRQYMYSMYCK